VLVALTIAMLATYAITDSLARGVRDSQLTQLLVDARAVSERATILGDNERREADRIAFTQNIPQLIASGGGPVLQSLARPLAAAGDVDYLILGTSSGR